MASTEAFTKLYFLTPYSKKLLESVISEEERAIQVNSATVERIKEKAREMGFLFLAVSQIDEHTIGIYFRSPHGIYLKTIPRVSIDPSLDIFDDMISHDYAGGLDARNEFYYHEVWHRPN